MDRREFVHLGAAAALALPLRRRHDPVRIAVASDERTAIPALHGTTLGLEEAAHTWTLLGREIALTPAEDPGAAALVSLVDATPAHPLTVDARPRYDCADPPTAFRIGLPSGTAGALWLPTLTRYGATQLNERFLRRFDEPMDEHAWAGWFALKLVAEAVLRARTVQADALARWLLSERARFDGHKGRPLAFDAQRRLVQPAFGADGLPADSEILCAQ